MVESKTRFKKGQKPGPGRPKGLPNKIPSTVKQGFLDAFKHLQGDPQKNLIAWAKKNPNLFYPLISKLIPAEVKGAFTGKTTLEIIRQPKKPNTNFRQKVGRSVH